MKLDKTTPVTIDTPMYFVVALGCEAKPLLAAGRFKSIVDVRGFPVFHNGRDWLVVSGVGKSASAAACGYLASRITQHDGLWINLGIAGSGCAELGEAVIAHQVRDGDTGETWYPTMIATLPVRTLSLNTFSVPHTDYGSAGMYDMESSGFMATALRFSSGEWVHSFKVISDTAGESVEAVSSKRVTQWVETALPNLMSWAETLRRVRAETLDAQTAVLAQWTAQCLQGRHTTTYQKHRLKRLLRRWIAREGAISSAWDQLLAIGDTQILLDSIEREIEKLPNTLKVDAP